MTEVWLPQIKTQAAPLGRLEVWLLPFLQGWWTMLYKNPLHSAAGICHLILTQLTFKDKTRTKALGSERPRRLIRRALQAWGGAWLRLRFVTLCTPEFCKLSRQMSKWAGGRGRTRAQHTVAITAASWCNFHVIN